MDFPSRPREPSFYNVAPSFRGELFLEIEGHVWRQEKHVRAVQKLRGSLVRLSTTEVNPYEWFRGCVHGSPILVKLNRQRNGEREREGSQGVGW